MAVSERGVLVLQGGGALGAYQAWAFEALAAVESGIGKVGGIDHPDLANLRRAGPRGPVTLMHLIHRKAGFETGAKDYEFSRLSMQQHWAAGKADVAHTFAHRAWKARVIGKDELQVFDLGHKARKEDDDEGR